MHIMIRQGNNIIRIIIDSIIDEQVEAGAGRVDEFVVVCNAGKACKGGLGFWLPFDTLDQFVGEDLQLLQLAAAEAQVVRLHPERPLAYPHPRI